MWIGIGIAIAAVVVLALLVWAWRRAPHVSGEVRQWQDGLDALGRTASREPIGGARPAPAEPYEIGETVHVIGRRGRDD